MRISESDVIETYRATRSVKATARISELSEHTVRHLLFVAGEYTSSRAEQIAKLAARGYTRLEVAKILGLSQSCVFNYWTYAHGPTSCGERSKNALRIEQCRRKKRERAEGQGKQYREKAPRKTLSHSK